MITTLRLVTQSALLQKQRSVTLLNGLAGAGQVVEAARLQAIAASLSAVDAEAAQAAAELAADVAAAAGKVYPTAADGVAGGTGVAAGQYYWVPSASDAETLMLYRNVGGVATDTGKRTTSAEVCARFPSGAPSYSNAGGTGDRTTAITVTATSGLIASGTASNLVDGAFADNSTDSIAFSAVTVADKSLTFDFGLGSERIITEATWKQNGTQSHGTWKWQVSADGVSYSDAGSSFALGGATTQVQPVLASFTGGYRYYRLLGVSGSASAGPFIREVEFKVTAAITQNLARLSDISRFPSWFPASKLVAAYFFDEATAASVPDVYRQSYPIDLALPTTPNVTQTLRGLKAAVGLIQTPVLPSIRSQTILYRTSMGGANGFLISGGASSGSGTLQDAITVAEAHKVAGFGLDLFTPPARTSDGAGCYALNRGGWAMYHREMAATYSSAFGLGGRHSTTTSRCDDFEINCAFFWNDVLTADEQAAVYRFVRQRATRVGIYLHRADAPSRNDLYLVIGESNADGRSLISGLSAADQAAAMRHTRIAASQGGAAMVPPDAFELGYNQKFSDATHLASLKFGPEYGVAFRRRSVLPAGSSLSENRGLALIAKVGLGGTRIAPSSIGGTAATTWNVGETVVGGLFYVAWRQILHTLQTMVAQGHGYRDTVRVGLWLGLNDAANIIYAADSATYQGYLQALYDKLVALLPGCTVQLICFRPHNHDPASNATALSNIRTAYADFDTANANVSVVDTDAYGLEADSVHYNAAASKAMGVTLHG